MEVAIYKKGQGFWTRVLSLIAAATLLVAGVAWLTDELSYITWPVEQTLDVQIERPEAVDARTPLGIELYQPEDAVGVAVRTAGGIAQRQGLQYADVIQTVNGQVIRSEAEFIAALREVQAGEPVTLMVVRQWNAMQLVRLIVAVVLLVAGTALLLWLMNKPRVADFMIATEAEMRKVNWPTRRELAASTWVVICGTFMLALVLWVINLGFAELFQELGILRLPE